MNGRGTQNVAIVSKKRPVGDGAIAAYYVDLAERLGSATEADSVRRANALPLRPSLRSNRHRLGAEGLSSWAERVGLRREAIPWTNDAFWFTSPAGFEVGRTLEHWCGRLYLQEAASMLPAAVARRLQGGRLGDVLDLCAAPGSKTTDLSADLGETDFLVANEPDGERIKILAHQVARCAAPRVMLMQRDGREAAAMFPETFDTILVDAPCSGEGNVRSDKRALDRWSKDTAARLAPIQRGLLDAAFRALKPGGLLLYSTCTLAHAEDEGVATAFAADHAASIEIVPLGGLFEGANRSATPEGFLLMLPHHFDSEGFFVTAFRKSIGERATIVQATGSPLARVDAKKLTTASDRLRHVVIERFGIDPEPFGLIAERKGTFYLVPHRAATLSLLHPFNRPGMKIATSNGDDFEFDHDFAMVLGARFSRGVVDVDRPTARRFVAGMEIPIGDLAPEAGFVAVRHEGTPLGFVLVRRGRVKTKLPRGWVRALSDP